MSVADIKSNQILTITLSSGIINDGLNLLDEVKKGSLKFDCYYSAKIRMIGKLPRVLSFIIPSTPLPPTPTKEGHTFVGWYLDSALTIPYDNSPIYADTQLYAKFNINTFQVSFNSVGGNAVANQIVNWNTAATLTTPTKEGYNFVGWFIGETQYTNAAIKGIDCKVDNQTL